MFAQARLSVLALALMVGLGAAHAAPAKGANKGSAGVVSPAAQSVQTIATATALARYGEANKDPLALLTAAKMISEASANRQAATAQRSSGTPGDAKDKPDLQAADQLIAKARALASSASRDDLVALADNMAKSAPRGARNGAGMLRTVVRTNAVDQYRVVFKAGEVARVAVSGDGDSDLDLYVYDEKGNPICQDTDATDDMICSWTPRWEGPFTIRVRNLGVANQYVIVHN